MEIKKKQKETKETNRKKETDNDFMFSGSISLLFNFFKLNFSEHPSQRNV